MASLNRVMLIGNLGQDPDLKYTPTGKAVANFTIATKDRWKDKDGQSQERTEWHRIVLWGRQAEIAKDYLRKGKQIYLEGRLQTRNYDDKDGNKRWITEIIGYNLQMLGKREETGAEEIPSGVDVSGQPPASGMDEDLPF